MNPESISTLPGTIQKLLTERSAHSDAVAAIDATLARITSALNVKAVKMASPVTPKMSAKKPSVVETKAKSGTPAGTAAEFVLGFVKAHPSATSREINLAWQASGRKRTADITLSQLTKEKKLKRTPLGPGIRGSSYMVIAA